MAVAPGFYGKLPSRGDFVSHGLPRSFLGPWNAAMDAALRRSQEVLGDAFVPAWLVAPVWYFSLAPGVAGPDAAAGLFFPSVDRVGRYYPMTVAVVIGGLSAAPDPEGMAPWLRSCGEVALEAMAEDWPPERLAPALAAYGMPLLATGNYVSQAWNDGLSNTIIIDLEQRDLTTLIIRAMQALENRGNETYSV